MEKDNNRLLILGTVGTRAFDMVVNLLIPPKYSSPVELSVFMTLFSQPRRPPCKLGNMQVAVPLVSRATGAKLTAIKTTKRFPDWFSSFEDSPPIIAAPLVTGVSPRDKHKIKSYLDFQSDSESCSQSDSQSDSQLGSRTNTQTDVSEDHTNLSTLFTIPFFPEYKPMNPGPATNCPSPIHECTFKRSLPVCSRFQLTKTQRPVCIQSSGYGVLELEQDEESENEDNFTFYAHDYSYEYGSYYRNRNYDYNSWCDSGDVQDQERDPLVVENIRKALIDQFSGTEVGHQLFRPSRNGDYINRIPKNWAPGMRLQYREGLFFNPDDPKLIPKRPLTGPGRIPSPLLSSFDEAQIDSADVARILAGADFLAGDKSHYTARTMPIPIWED